MQISAVFEETANQEKEHAKRFFNFLQGGNVEITASFPAGEVKSTAENLKEAAEGEHFEWSDLYLGFARTAQEEGFTDIATVFNSISIAEKQHEKRYAKLRENLLNKEVFKKKQKTVWSCRNCGYIYEGEEAPQKCPACSHPQSWFELLGENW